MKKIIGKLVKERKVIIFISGSAGELDWVLPILAFLLKEGFNINIIFLTNHARKSVERNKTLSDFINKQNSRIQLAFLGGYFFEKIERLGYLSYRIFLKLKLGNISIINKTYRLYDKLFEYSFMTHLPSEIMDFAEEKYLFISEFPSLRRPRNNWIRKKFCSSIFFYCPHSPHIYAEDLDRQSQCADNIDFDKKAFLLLGHPEDFTEINDGRELAACDLQKLFIGHPKYSENWLENLKQTAKVFRSNAETRDKINILVVSRGYGSYLDKDSYAKLVNSTVKAINNRVPNYQLFIKKHPREISSHWDRVKSDYPSVKVVTEHILQLATKVDFVITFWGSGAMDCFSLGVPVIEYWDPNKHSKGQVLERNSYTTIYRKLGVVIPANTEVELEGAISELLAKDFKMPIDGLHPFFIDLMNRSNQWDKVIKKVLVSSKLING